MTQTRPLVLLTNDDGYTSPGLRAAWRALDDDFETVVVAPERQRSWTGKAISNPGPLKLKQAIVDGKEVNVLCDGLPADCTNIGLFHICPRKPVLVISGINIGPNFTSSLALSSGTIGGALEAAENDVLGLAVSFDLDMNVYHEIEAGHEERQVQFFEDAAAIVAKVARRLVASPLPDRVKLINLIIPQQLAEPLRLVPCEPLAYEYGSVFVRDDDKFRNRSVGFVESLAEVKPLTDVWAVRQGWVAYTLYTGRLEQYSNPETRIEL
jgi:5'-nucleotidase